MGGHLRLKGGGRGSCLVPLVLKCFLILFKGELQGGEKNQDLGELPTETEGKLVGDGLAILSVFLKCASLPYCPVSSL